MKISILGRLLLSGGSLLLRRLTTAAQTAAATRNSPANRQRIDKNHLYKILWSVGSNNKVSGVLYQIMREGKQFYKSDLVFCVKMLRKFGRYQHCLEILEWMEKGTMNCSEREYALRLGIIRSLKGIHEVEKYFDGLPPAWKSHSAYGALLNCYCTEKMTDKAWALFEKMDRMNYASNNLAFNNLMGLFMKVEQPEKIPPLVQEMKKRNIPLSSHSYSIWIQSYGCLNDLEGVERVMDEVQEQKVMKNDWTIYSNLAAVYIRVGHSENAETALKKLEEILDNLQSPNRLAYHYLISLGASIGNLEFLTRVWDKFKSKFEVCNNHSYLTMLNALSKLNDIEVVKKCFKDWELSYQSYDARLPIVVIGAYLRHDMVEEAEDLLRDATNRYGQKIWNAHVSLAKHYLGKGKIDLALRHMELVIDNKGKPFQEGVNSFFKYFKEENDVDGAENFFQMLRKAQQLDTRAYLWLLQTYAAAGKTAPGLQKRMQKDGIDIGTEHVELLKKVCTD